MSNTPRKPRSLVFGQRKDSFINSVVRLHLDLKYETERDSLKQVLSSESGWECAIVSIGDLQLDPPRSSDWEIALDLFVDQHECDYFRQNAWDEDTEMRAPEQHLGLRLVGMDYDQGEAIYAQIRARFDVRTGPVSFPLRPTNDD